MKKIIEFLKKHRKLLSNIFTILVIVLMIIYLYKNRLVFDSLKNLKVEYIVYIILSQVTTVAVTALLNQKIIQTLDRDISYSDAFHLQYANNFLNKIISEGGALFRGYYLKKTHKLPYTKYISTIAGSYILSFFFYSMMGLVSMAYLFFVKGKSNYWILIFFIALFFGTIILIWVNPRFKNKKNNRILGLINSILEGWVKIKENKKNLLVFSSLTLLLLLLHVPLSVFVYRGLGHSIGVFESLYMSCMGIITTFINVTPNGIGIKEGIYMFSSDIIGLNSEVLLLGSLISRAITLASSFILGGISYFKISSKLKKENIE